MKIDLGKGLKQGFLAIRKGTIVAGRKAGQLSEEGKRQYRMLELKARIHKSMAELGSRVYEVMNSRAKNPAQDDKVKDIFVQIKKYRNQLALWERAGTGSVTKKIRKAASSRL